MKNLAVFPKKAGPQSSDREFWKDKSVLITGGTGSFGRTLVQHLFRHTAVRRLVVFSRDELKQHDMRMAGLTGGPLEYVLGDVRDFERVRRALRGIDVVLHAAALKQVPSCEHNPFEAVLTNIYGTQNVLTAAQDCGVKRVLSLSTDKAVAPVNLYGATKLCSEKLVLQSNSALSPTLASCVRYGNVMGSRGSVVPQFLEQSKTGAVQVTDPRMSRFWVTLDQSVAFVLRCAREMAGGEVFVPKLPSTTIGTLAEALAPGCRTEIVGIRPGEKLNELLISEDEARHTFEFDDMYVVQRPGLAAPKPAGREGKPVPEAFTYSSGSTRDRLTVEQIRELVAGPGFVEERRKAVK